MRQFDHNFTEMQFLLNTSTGSDAHLKRGLIAASRELDELRLRTGSPALPRVGPRASPHSSRGGCASNSSR